MSGEVQHRGNGRHEIYPQCNEFPSRYQYASFMATKPATKRKRHSKTAPKRKWSARVMQRSDALDLESQIFTSGSPEKIAKSLKRSAEKSKRRKGTPFQSAMSMLNFYINRAGKNLSVRKRNTLEKSKNKLRELFRRPVKKKASKS